MEDFMKRKKEILISARLTKEQKDFLEQNGINVSQLLRGSIDELKTRMKK